MDAYRNFRAGLPPPAECLAILVGVTQVTVFGLAGIANPVDFAKGYGLPLSLGSSGQQQQSGTEGSKGGDNVEKTQIALVSAISARNVTNGVLLLALACYARDRRALGIAMTANAISTLADTCIVRWFGAADQASLHITGLVSSLGIGSSLLYWRRDNPWW